MSNEWDRRRGGGGLDDEPPTWRPPGKPGGSSTSNRVYGGASVVLPETGAPVQRKTDVDARAPEQRRQDQCVRDEVVFGFVHPQPYIDVNGAEPVQRRASTTAIDAPRADSISEDRATIGAAPAGAPAEQRPELDASKADSLREDRATIAPEAAPGPLASARVARAAGKNPRLVSKHGIRPAELGTDAAPDSAAFAQAVAQFQAEHGLAIDGIVGPKTAAAVRGSAGPAAATVDGSAPEAGDDPDARGTGSALLQMKGGPEAAADADVHRAAAAGTAGRGQPLPHLETIQEAFGGHDVTNVKAHVGGAAADAAHAMGAVAYATGNDVAFGGQPDLHTAAHEAAHVVQQRGGVQLKGGVGQASDSYEQHADAVADKVVRGESAEALLGDLAPRAAPFTAIQRKEDEPGPTTAGDENSPSGVRVQVPKSSLKIPLTKKVVSIFGQDVTLSISADVGNKKALGERKWGADDEAGDLGASVKLLEPQLDLVGREAATSFLKGGGAATLFAGLAVKVEGSGPGWSVTKTGVKGQLAAIVLKFEGSVPELFDHIGRPELKEKIDIKVSGQAQIPVASFDEAAFTALVAEGERMFRRMDELDAKGARLAELAEKDRVLSSEKAAKVRAAETGWRGDKFRLNAEYRQIEKQIRKNRDEIWKLTHELKIGAEEVAEHKGRMAKLAAKVTGKAGRAVSKSLIALGKTAFGRFIKRLLPIINVISFLEDAVAILQNVIYLVGAEFEFLGGGADGLGGGSGANPDVESKDDGQGGTEDHGTPTGTGGALEGTEGGGGSDPDSGGRGAARGGAGSAKAPQTGSGQRADPDHVSGDSAQHRHSPAGGSTKPATGADTGGAPRSADVELSLEAKMLLAQSRVGNQGLDDEARRRLNQIAASLSDEEAHRLVDVLGDWKPGSGAEMLAELEQAIAGLRSGAAASSGTEGGQEASLGSGQAQEGDGSKPARRHKRRGPGRGGDEDGAGSKDVKRDPLQRKHVFPISYELIQQVMAPLLDASGQLTVSPKEAEQAIVEKAGELLEGKVRKGSRGLAMFLDVDGATAPRNVAAAGEPPRWEFKLLLLVEVGGKRTTDVHRLTYEPTIARGQAAYSVDFSEVAEQFVVERGKIELKEVGAVVRIGRWEGELLRVRWQDGRPGGKAEVRVKPVGKIRDGERLGRQEVRNGDAIWIVVGG